MNCPGQLTFLNVRFFQNNSQHMLFISGVLTLPLATTVERKWKKRRSPTSYFMMASFSNKGKKHSVSNGLSAVALGSILSTGGVAAGTQVAATAASQLKLLGETEPEDQVRLRSITQLPTQMKVQHIS